MEDEMHSFHSTPAAKINSIIIPYKVYISTTFLSVQNSQSCNNPKKKND